MLQEFRQFAMCGHGVDIAVGISIGGAFGTVVRRLVSDVITLPIGQLPELHSGAGNR